MMNRKKQRMIRAIICVALIIAMLAGILLPYVLPGVE